MSSSISRLSNGLDMAGLGERIRQERARQQLSLDELAAQAGVSRSMLSEVERGVKVPTILVLDKIATGLGTSIARLLGEEQPARVIVLRREEQNVARDPAGWERRILSPVLPDVEFEFMQTTIPPRVNAGTFLPHAPGSREYLVVEQGALHLTIDETTYLLEAGDSIYYAADCKHTFENRGNEPCRYYLVMSLAKREGQSGHSL